MTGGHRVAVDWAEGITETRCSYPFLKCSSDCTAGRVAENQPRIAEYLSLMVRPADMALEVVILQSALPARPADMPVKAPVAPGILSSCIRLRCHCLPACIPVSCPDILPAGSGHG